ncbi:MAG: hypothetical protein IJK93_10770 [Muribaculaceae bacterium]|nr:hypothetical protein [Muribaculaceae bacterium]
MKPIRSIVFTLLACVMLTSTGQTTSQEEWEWYLDEVVNDVFVARNNFEYYYTPSKAEMEQQRQKGEVTYFLNTPSGYNVTKTKNIIDRLMASYDDIKAVTDWHMEKGSYWKDFRFEKNRFHFSIGRKTLEDSKAHFVSVTETAGYYKSLKKDKGTKASSNKEKTTATKRSSRNRKAITQEDVDQLDAEAPEEASPIDEAFVQPAAKSEKERRQEAREKQAAQKREQRLAKQREKEQQREQEQALKEAEKQKKAEAKKQKQEEERLKREEKKKLREDELAREKAEREKARAQKAERRQAAAKTASKYHYDDVALWLSEKYDFTQSSASSNSCTMFSTIVHDVDMAKLAIKNCLKGSNARMAVPWRLNNETQAVETGYTVDDHVLVFTIGKDQEERVTLTVTEISDEEFELFKQSILQ